MTGQSPQAGNPAPPGDQVKIAECDLVMKGGITSGIVYPPAVKKLSDKYRFRSIGGTSVGAMAAAAIAAAEFYRQTHHGSTKGFDCLDSDVKEWLKADKNLLNLFQPTWQTRPLLEFAMALQSTAKGQSPQSQQTKSSMWSVIGRFLKALLFHFPFAFSWSAFICTVFGLILLASFPLAVLALYSLINHTGVVLTFWPLISLIVFAAVGLWLGWQTGNVIGGIFYLSHNFFGICTGYTPTPQDMQLVRSTIALPAASNQGPATAPATASSQSAPAGQNKLDFSPGTHTNLTDWLNYMMSYVSGKQSGELLTMKDLTEQKIDLKMVTTNLSQTLPYIMPEGLRNFIFNAEEMTQFFPGHVIRHMIMHPPDTNDLDLEKRPLIPPDMLPPGYHFFPRSEELPVIVCTRLSLSYPLLLSAMPLYAIDSQAYQTYKQNKQRLSGQALHKNWFSDGGISSNFPIQFFDAWLPDRPTLGINLLTKGPSATCVMLDDADMLAPEDKMKNVFLLKANTRPDLEWHDVSSLIKFGFAIFGTAQNYRDIMQASLPSYRERIAQIRLDRNEGGLNLRMNGKLIDDVSARGGEAGNLLYRDFNFEQHTWVRFLVLMAQLEKNVAEIENELTQIDNQLASGKLPNGYPYCGKKNSQWPGDAKPRVDELLTFVRAWNVLPQDDMGKPCFFGRDAPLPKPVLRVTPEI